MSSIITLREDGNLDKHILNLNNTEDTESEYHIYHVTEHGENIYPSNLDYPTDKKLKFIFGGDDCPFYDEYRKLGEVHLFWNYWLYGELNRINLSEINTNEFVFDKFLLILNNYPKRHRRIMMNELDSKKLLDNSYYSWLLPNERNSDWYDDDNTWPGEINKKNLPSQLITSDEIPSKQGILPVEYYKTFISVVNETTDLGVFHTEKTWIPLLIGKPFIVNGAKGTHAKLKEHGFLLYDELFNYDFDLYDSIEDRIKSIVEQLSNLDSDYNELYEILKPKLIHNQKLCFDMVENNIGIPNFKGVKPEMWDTIVDSAKIKLNQIKETIKIY